MKLPTAQCKVTGMSREQYAEFEKLTAEFHETLKAAYEQEILPASLAEGM